MATYITENKVIKIPFPEAYYKEILSKAGVKDNNPSPKSLKKVFVLMVDDFLKGDISVDEVSAICNKLFDKVTKIKDDEQNLFQAILSGSELSFYIRKQNLLGLFNGFLKDVLKYADEFRN